MPTGKRSALGISFLLLFRFYSIYLFITVLILSLLKEIL